MEAGPFSEVMRNSLLLRRSTPRAGGGSGGWRWMVGGKCAMSLSSTLSRTVQGACNCVGGESGGWIDKVH